MPLLVLLWISVYDWRGVTVRIVLTVRVLYGAELVVVTLYAVCMMVWYSVQITEPLYPLVQNQCLQCRASVHVIYDTNTFLDEWCSRKPQTLASYRHNFPSATWRQDGLAHRQSASESMIRSQSTNQQL